MLSRIFILFLAIAAGNAWGWSLQGHQWITESAAMQLKQTEAEQYDALLKQGVLVPPKLFHSSVPIRLSALGTWPDKVRDIPLQDLFKKYGSGAVPEALTPWAGRSTDDWHYQNILLVGVDGFAIGGKSGNTACEGANNGQLVKVWSALLKSFAQAADDKDRNVVLALILHLEADAYQPLHLASALDSQCKSDRGGNGTCVETQHNGKGCRQNLHQLWDEGFGVFELDRGWHKKQHPNNIFEFKTAEQLAAKSLPHIYQQDASVYQSEDYLKASQEVVYNNVDYAVGHTVLTLRYLLTQLK